MSPERGPAVTTFFALTTALLAVSVATASAQSLSLAIRPPEPNQLSVDDGWNLDVTNGSGAAVAVVFVARFTETSRGQVYEARTSAVTIAPGATLLGPGRVGGVTVVQRAGVTTALSRFGALPDGRYTVCVDALPAGGGAALATTCIDQEVASLLPPVLFGPYNGSPVTDPYIIWSWFMQPVAGTGVRSECDLQVAEILPHQSPEEALRINPPILLRQGLRSSTWQTNEATRSLIPGQSYAWQVTAKLGTAAASRSEIWTFVYAGPTDSAAVASAEHAGERAYQPGQVSPFSGPSPQPGALANPSPPTAPTSPPAGPFVAAAPPPVIGAAAPAASPSTSFVIRKLAQGVIANMRGALSRQPSQFARLELDPTLTIGGSPITLNVLLASDQGSERPEVTRSAFGFAPRRRGIAVLQQVGAATTADTTRPAFQMRADSLRRAGRSPEEVSRQLDQAAALPAPAATASENEVQALEASAANGLARLPSFAVGSVTPDFSTLMMSGVTVNGGLVEYERHRLYEALAVGKVQRDDVPTGLAAPGAAPPQLYRNLYAARFGVGGKTGSHLIVSTLYARDDDQTRAILGARDTLPGSALQDNWVMGVAGRAADPTGCMLVDGELNTSLSNRDIGASTGGATTNGLGSLFGRGNVRSGSAVDWAGALRGGWRTRDATSRLAAGVRFVGPGYASAGVRGLRTDVRSYDGAYDQALAHNRVQFGCRLSYEQTGVVLPERGSARIARLDGHGEWHATPGTSVTVGYLHDRQHQHPSGGLMALTNNVDQADVRLRETARLGGLRTTSFQSAHVLHGTSNDPSGGNVGQAYQLAELVDLPSHVSLFVRAARTMTTTRIAGDVDPRVSNVEATVICDLPRGLENSLGATTADGATTRSRGIYVGSRLAFDHGKGAFELRWEYDRFTDSAHPEAGRREQIARMSVTIDP
jgi:hypothetical protein